MDLNTMNPLQILKWMLALEHTISKAEDGAEDLKELHSSLRLRLQELSNKE